MVRFKEYLNEMDEINKISEADVVMSILSIALLEEFDNLNEATLDTLDEGFLDGIKKVLDKFGLEVEKETGLIDFVKKFGALGGKILMAAIKKDKEEVKRLAKDISKEDFIKFVYNLDMVTAHVLTGPLHMIAAVLGVEIKVKEPKEPVKTIIGKVKDSIHDLIDGIETFISNRTKREKLIKNVKLVATALPVKI